MKWFMRKSRATTTLPALLGKLPGHADFVRAAGRSAAADVLDAWLVRAVGQLTTATKPECLGSVAFSLCVQAESRILLGILEPSHDSQGRSFPSAVFREVALDAWRPRLGELWQRAAAFRTAARALVHELQTQPAPPLSLSELTQRLEALPDLDASGTDASGTWANVPAGEFLGATLDTSVPENMYYALATLRAAFADATPPEGLALSCPSRDHDDAGRWLQLAAGAAARPHARVRQRLTPSAFYALDLGRSVISVSCPAPDVLRALTDTDYRPAQLWPLTTQQRAARDLARAQLLPIVPELASSTRALDLHTLAERLAHTERTAL